MTAYIGFVYDRSILSISISIFLHSAFWMRFFTEANDIAWFDTAYSAKWCRLFSRKI